MPICRECKWLKENKCTCIYRRNDGPERYCVNAIRKKYAPTFYGNVLEIGFGVNKLFRKSLPNNAIWYGIDPRYNTIQEHNRFGWSVTNMEFGEEFFDFVFAGQSMEHWSDNEEDLRTGLKLINRVLKTNGMLLIDVPIHLHGNEIFIKGDLKSIYNLFDQSQWYDITFENWRFDYYPLEPIQTWRNKNKEMIIKNSEQEIPSIWNLEITANKK